MLHIHVNAFEIAKSTSVAIERAGFSLAPFLVSPDREYRFVPNSHFTLKVESGAAFKASFARCVEILRADPVFVGFVEGEAVQKTCSVKPTKAEFSAEFPVGLKLAPWVRWRQSEIHLCVARDTTPGEWHDVMSSRGFHAALVEVGEVVRTIYTMQGDKGPIEQLFDRLGDYLGRSRIQSPCSMKLERTAAHWISPGFDRFPAQLVGLED